MNLICKKIVKTAFFSAAFLGTLLSDKAFSEATIPLSQQVSSSIELKAENFAVLKFRELIINESAEMCVIQPSKDAIAFLIIEKGPIKISGTLKGEGKIFLINPEGMTLGNNARIHASEVVFCNYMPVYEDFWKENPMQFKHQGPGVVTLGDQSAIFSESAVAILGDITTVTLTNPIIETEKIEVENKDPSLKMLKINHNFDDPIKYEFTNEKELLKIFLPKATVKFSSQ